jgi:signal transduction histidine kinase
VALSHSGSRAQRSRSVGAPSGRAAGRLLWLRPYRERIMDLLAFCAVLVLAALPPHVHAFSGHLEMVVFGVALGLPLLWRRSHPELVFGLLAAVALTQWLFDVWTAADAALLVAVYTVADRAPRRSAIAAGTVLEGGAVLASTRFPLADYDSLQAFVTISGLSIAATLMGVRKRDRRALLDSLQERAARLELERDQQRELVAAAERARIARDMHDIVAHNLTVMIALTDGAGRILQDLPDRGASEAIAAASATGRQALSEMRRLLGVLRHEEAGETLAPQPALAQIEQLVEQLRSAGLPARLIITGSSAALPEGLQLIAFRIVQEALTNVLRHAHGSVSADVELKVHAGQLELTVTNTGTSCEPTEPGRGLSGMGERVALYNGSIEAGPLAGGGWRVRARLPLSPPALSEIGA